MHIKRTGTHDWTAFGCRSAGEGGATLSPPRHASHGNVLLLLFTSGRGMSKASEPRKQQVRRLYVPCAATYRCCHPHELDEATECKKMDGREVLNGGNRLIATAFIYSSHYHPQFLPHLALINCFHCMLTLNEGGIWHPSTECNTSNEKKMRLVNSFEQPARRFYNEVWMSG